MKKFNSFETQLGESVVLTDKAKLSLYKKSQNSGYSVDILEEVYRRGYHCWTDQFGGNPDSFAFDRVNSFIAGGFASQLDEDLRQWFDPNHPKGGWKRINSKGEAIGPCAREPGEPKPKCMSNEKRAQLSKKERAAAVAAKRRHDPVADRSGKGGKPVNVSNVGKGKISEVYIEEKNAPTNPSLWSKAKSLARSKFDVYPSAYANGWAAKWYKSKGGGWKSVSEESELEEKCWTGYKQVGMKKKGDRMVPNCVPTKEDAEEHSKDFTKPSSRFIGSDELTDIYKQQTPGQIIKKIVREHLEEIDEISAELVGKVSNARFFRGETPSKVLIRTINKKFIESGKKKKEDKKEVKEDAVDIYTSPPERPAEVRQLRAPQKQAPRQLTSTSGRASGRIAGQTGSMTARPNVKVSSGVQPSIERSWKTSGRGTMGTSGGSMSATPKVSTAYSQGGVNVGKAMGASKQTSPVVKGMTSAGRAAVSGAEKAAPTVAKGLGTVARIAGGPVVGGVLAAMDPTPAGEKKSEFQRQKDLGITRDRSKENVTPGMGSAKNIEPVKGGSITTKAPDYFKGQVGDYKVKAGETLSGIAAKTGQSVDALMAKNPIASPNKIAAGAQIFTGDVPTPPKRPETESGGKTLKKIKEAISEATYKGKKVPLNKPMKGDVKKSKVFVDPDGDGKAQKVNFGDKNLSIKKHIPARKKSYCARSGGQGNLTDKTSANYWSRKAWNCEETEIDEARTFSNLYKKPRKGTVAYYAMMQRKKEERETPPIEPKDQMVGTAKIYKDKKEVNELSVPAGTTGKREKVSTPMVAVRMASGKIEKHPPGKSGSSGGGDE